MKPLFTLLKDQNCAQREFPLPQAGCSPKLPVSTSLSGIEGKAIASSFRIVFLSLIILSGGLPCWSSSGSSSDNQTIFLYRTLSILTLTQVFSRTKSNVSWRSLCHLLTSAEFQKGIINSRFMVVSTVGLVTFSSILVCGYLCWVSEFCLAPDRTWFSKSEDVTYVF